MNKVQPMLEIEQTTVWQASYVNGEYQDPVLLSSNFFVGDEVVVVVHERKKHNFPLTFNLIILESTENGWYSYDCRYVGYTPADGICWAYVRSVRPPVEWLNNLLKWLD